MSINLEWLRTFRAVYKSKSLTRASKQLLLTQPAVSQHIAALEARAGIKLFTRKSRGVAPTEYAKTLNNMVANSLDDLEKVEALFSDESKIQNPIITIGISEHLYKATLAGILSQIEEQVHIKFGDQGTLIKEVEASNILIAVIPEKINTFDTVCHSLFKQKLILVCTPDIDIAEFEQLFQVDKKLAERWLSQQAWYSHRPITPFIKQFWLKIFDKKRPTIVPQRVIPNENEVLYQLSQGSGMALCYDNNAAPYIADATLVAASIDTSISREVCLLANRSTDSRLIELMLGMLT